MKTYNLSMMKNGWFVGSFSPNALCTNECEVAVKKYLKGDKEKKHFHKVATEVTLILEGEVKMFDKLWSSGDILTIAPGEATDFEAMTDSITVVIKTPSLIDDKYYVD